MTCEYLGTTLVPSQADNFTRTYHLWGYVEFSGELTALHYNTSSDLSSASGVIKRSDCTTDHLKILWRAGEKFALEADFDDFSVIEKYSPEVIIAFPGPKGSAV